MKIFEPLGSLMRWRLRLSAFDFEVLCRKRLLNTQIDALLRLGITAEAEPVDKLKVPCFVVRKYGMTTKDWSDNICDDIPASEASQPPSEGYFTAFHPE